MKQIRIFIKYLHILKFVWDFPIYYDPCMFMGLQIVIWSIETLKDYLRKGKPTKKIEKKGNAVKEIDLL